MSITDQPARGKGTFRMVPDSLWQHEHVIDSDIKIWCALSFLGRPRLYTDATDDTIARTAKVSLRTVSRSLDRLQQLGFIERPDGERGRRIILKPDGAGELGPRLHVIE